MNDSIRDVVKDYYGNSLKGTADLQTDACCTLETMPENLKSILQKIHPEVTGRYYGCGLVIPELLEGLRVLDLGSGSGQDCYMLSALVGEKGSVVGVDMTDGQLEVANRYVEYHREQFDYANSNVAFYKGELEKLADLAMPDNSFDLIVSNCVINLCEDKPAVLAEAYRLLKPGGELYFSDVYADRRVPDAVMSDPELYGECLGGALYWQDFLTLACDAGFVDARLVSDRPLAINNAAIAEKTGDIGFYSAVYRLFKLPELERTAEDYGQSVIYKGTIPAFGCSWALDKAHAFPKGQVVPVSGNTFCMLKHSRYARHFDFSGDFANHRGAFVGGAGTGLPFEVGNKPTQGCCG